MSVAKPTIPMTGSGGYPVASPGVCLDSSVCLLWRELRASAASQHVPNARRTDLSFLLLARRFSRKRHSNPSRCPDTAPFM
jgi:hypothetical protein